MSYKYQWILLTILVGNSNYFWQIKKKTTAVVNYMKSQSVKVWQARILKAGSKFSECGAARRPADGILYEILLWLVFWLQRAPNKFTL